MIKLGHTVGNLDFLGFFGGGMLTIVVCPYVFPSHQRILKSCKTNFMNMPKYFQKPKLITCWYIGGSLFNPNVLTN
jgi:hypothetical protein